MKCFQNLNGICLLLYYSFIIIMCLTIFKIILKFVIVYFVLSNITDNFFQQFAYNLTINKNT